MTEEATGLGKGEIKYYQCLHELQHWGYRSGWDSQQSFLCVAAQKEIEGVSRSKRICKSWSGNEFPNG